MENNKKHITCDTCNSAFNKELFDANQDEISCIYCNAIINNTEQGQEQIANINSHKKSKKKSRKLTILSNALLVTTILGCFTTTGVYQFRNELAEDPRFRPYVKNFCEKLDCKLTNFQDVSKIMIHNPKILTDKNNKLAMTLSANIENRARLAQPYPNLQINFLNQKGEVLYKQVYKPNQYLKNTTNNNILFKKENTDIEIKFLARNNSDATDLSLIILADEDPNQSNLG